MFHIPLPLSRHERPNFLVNPISDYFAARPPYSKVFLQTIIFTPPPQPPRILLFRYADDESEPLNYWRVPGGKPIASDPTMLYSLTRIFREQSALELSYVAALCGAEKGPAIHYHGSWDWMRMMFLTEDADFAVKAHEVAGEPEVPTVAGQGPPAATLTEREDEVNSALARVAWNSGPVKTVLWAYENDLKEIIDGGQYPKSVNIQYQIMLEAFAFYRRDFAGLDTLRFARENETLDLGHGF